MPGLKLNHVGKRGPRYHGIATVTFFLTMHQNSTRVCWRNCRWHMNVSGYLHHIFCDVSMNRLWYTLFSVGCKSFTLPIIRVGFVFLDPPCIHSSILDDHTEGNPSSAFKSQRICYMLNWALPNPSWWKCGQARRRLLTTATAYMSFFYGQIHYKIYIKA